MQNQDVRHKNPRLYKQSGNALWFILVALGLLAALSLAISRNSGKMADNLDQEESRIMAERIARDLTSLTSAIQKMQTVNGCSEEEISFDNDRIENASPGAAFNPKSPITGGRAYTCHVYDVRGGGLSFDPLPETYFTAAAIAGFSPETGYFFSGANSVNGVGPEAATETLCTGSPSPCGDLIISTAGVKDSICQAYNTLVGISSTPEDDDDFTSQLFVGTYAAATADSARFNTGTDDATSALYGVKSACVFSSASPVPGNVIYKVAIGR